LDDGVAFDDFLNVIAGRFVGLEKNVNLVDAAKQLCRSPICPDMRPSGKAM